MARTEHNFLPKPSIDTRVPKQLHQKDSGGATVIGGGGADSAGAAVLSLGPDLHLKSAFYSANFQMLS